MRRSYRKYQRNIVSGKGTSTAFASIPVVDTHYRPPFKPAHGGIGISKITATGNVYNLRDLAYFPGAYVQARYGAVIGDKSTGKLWLRNSNGVVLQLRARGLGLVAWWRRYLHYLK